MEGFPKVLSDTDLALIVPWAIDYAMSHGLVLRTKDNPERGDVVTHAPFALLPSPVPKHCFEAARDVQKDFNLLMHRVANNPGFLYESLQSAIKVDDFTRHLWEIYQSVNEEGTNTHISLGLHRSDYMFDCDTPTNDLVASGRLVAIEGIHLRQIEFNTMASSFGGLAQQLPDYHRMVLAECGKAEHAQHIPVNKAADGLAEAMVTAWEAYGNAEAVILFQVYSVERNIYDQRHLEYSIRRLNHKVKVIRRSLMDIQQRGTLGADRTLLIDGEEVAIVYQRSGYTPADFTTDKDWETRLLLERSRAVLCPSAAYHLAGTKKVQQVLSKPGVVERFIQDPEAVSRIRNTFAQQYSLDMDAEGDKHVAMAMAAPANFVLKPQREGGGNNTFGSDIPAVLSAIRNSEERSAYVLMDRVHPVPVRNYPMVSGNPISRVSMVSELGIYGTFVMKDEQVLLNKQEGYLLRTKPVGTEEGGIATGYAVLDTPYLVT